MGRQSTKRFARLDGLLAACAGRGASSGIVASRVGGAATSLSKSAGRCPDAHGIFRASPTVHQCGHEGRVWVRFDPLTPAQPNGRSRRVSAGGAAVSGRQKMPPKPTSPQQELRSDYSMLRQIRAAQPKHSHQAEFRPTLNSTISCRTGAHLSFRGGGAEGPRPSQNGLAPVENCPDPPPITTG